MIDTLFGIGRLSSMTESAMDPEIAGINLDTVEECAGDPFEFLTAAVYENQLTLQNIDSAIMVCEYAYLKENGTEMIYEENVMTNFFKKVKAMLKKAWDKIVAFFKKIFSWLANIIKSDKKFVEKYEADCKKAKPVDLDIKGYKYDVFAPERMLDTLSSGLKVVEGFDIDAMSNKETTDKQGTKILNETRGAICKVGNKSASKEITQDDFAKELTKALKGGETDPSTIKGFDCKTAIEEVKNAKTTKKALQDTYDAAKSLINLSIASVNRWEKEVKMNGTDKQAEKASKVAHSKVSVLTAMVNIATMINNQGAKMITANNRQNRKCIPVALKKQKDATKKKKDSTNESFVDSIFDLI